MMDEKQFKKLLVEDVAAAIKSGLLPEYEYKVSVTTAKSWCSNVCFYTWIADVPGVEEVLTDIFTRHKYKSDRTPLFHGVFHPKPKYVRGMPIDKVLDEWKVDIQRNVDEFYRTNPTWKPKEVQP